MSDDDESNEAIEEDWFGNDNEGCMTKYCTFQTITLELIRLEEISTNAKNDIPLSCKLHLDCIENLTPVDIMNLYNGIEDATGNKFWMGAKLFIEAFAVVRGDFPNNNLIQNWKRKLFNDKTILELGCGTGASGLSLIKIKEWALAREITLTEDEISQSIPKPKSMCLTDSDANAVDLCRRNYELNFIHNRIEEPLEGTSKVSHQDGMGDEVRIQKLPWVMNQGPDLYDTVIATDVVYDLSALQPLMVTASSHLKQNGYFVLSHIPRASVNGALVGKASILEDLICEMAQRVGLQVQSFFKGCEHSPTEVGALRPLDICSSNDLQDCTFTEMDEAGAALLLFQKL